MGSVTGYIVAAAQIIAGVILIATPFGVPLIISGVSTAVMTAIAPRPASSDGFKSSPTYGFDNTTNAAFEGSALAFVLGKMQIAPSLVSLITEQDGKKQRLKALFHCGSGGRYGIESIGDIRLQDQPVGHFKDVSVTTRLGTSDQTAIKGFEKVGIPFADGTEFSKGVVWTYTTHAAVDEVALVLVFTRGLYSVDTAGKDKGTLESAGWRAKVEYQDEGSTEWHTVLPAEKTDDGWSGRAHNEWKVVGKTTAAKRMVMRIPFDTTKIRTIRVTAKNGNTGKKKRNPTMVRVEEITDDARAYAGHAMLAIEAVASAQLSGGIPTVTCVVEGWKVGTAWTGGTDASGTWTRNPVELLREIFLNTKDGVGRFFDSTYIDDGTTSTWLAVRHACNVFAESTGEHAQERYMLDLVVDTYQDAEEWVGHILATFNGLLFEADGLGKLALDDGGFGTTLVAGYTTPDYLQGISDRTFDGRQTPAASTRPILALPDGKADISEVEIPVDERLTHVKVVYWDEDENYARRWTDEIVDPDYVAGDPRVSEEMYLPGVTRQAQALRMGRGMINKARLRTRIFEIGAGIGDLDLYPLDIVTLYVDSPELLGTLVQVLTVQIGPDHRARIMLLEYEATAFSVSSDVLQPLAPSLSRADGLGSANQIPDGGSGLNLKEEHGSGGANVLCNWSWKGDVNRDSWKVFHAKDSLAKGTLVATLESDEDTYLLLDPGEDAHWITVVAVNHVGVEEDWKATPARGKIVLSRLGVTPSEPQNAGGGQTGALPSVKVTLEPPPKSDPPVLMEITRGPDEDRGQLVGTAVVEREGITGDGGLVSVTVPLPASPGRGTGGARQTYTVRGVSRAGRNPGTAVTFSSPSMDIPNHKAVVLASVVGATLTGFSSPAGTDAYEFVADDGVRLRAHPPASDMTAGSGWGSPDSGRFRAEPYGSFYMTAATVRSQVLDSGSTSPYVLECFDEAHRKTAASTIAGIRIGDLGYPVLPEADADWKKTPLGPAWTSRLIRGDGTSILPALPPRWRFRVGGTTSACSGSDWAWHTQGQLVEGRYVQTEFVMNEPVGLHQMISPRVYVRAWVPWSEDGLGKDWDAGPHTIRARRFHADVATGTSPLIIDSTTMVNNLNADLLDGLHAGQHTVVTKSGNYTATTADEVILCTGTITITLPAAGAAGIINRQFTIKKIDADAAGDITIDTDGGTIDGSATAMIERRHDSLDFISDGTNWWVI